MHIGLWAFDAPDLSFYLASAPNGNKSAPEWNVKEVQARSDRRGLFLFIVFRAFSAIQNEHEHEQ
jgi:hypothetical protein